MREVTREEGEQGLLPEAGSVTGPQKRQMHGDTGNPYKRSQVQ